MAEAFTLENKDCAPVNPPSQTSQPLENVALAPLCAPECSLVEELGDLVDDLRQLNTDLGLRPYRLFSIVTKWSGGQIGRGTQTVVSEKEFLPTPVIMSASLRGEMVPAGYTERGDMRVTELSPRYTEDDIRALFHVQPLPDGYEGFIEMRMDGRRASNTQRRRFIVTGFPELQADRFQWTARLNEQNAQRSRRGVLSSKHGVVP